MCPTSPTDGKVFNKKSQRERRKRYTVVGTPWYMAPEMLKGNKYDEKVDVFAFGIIMCELIGRVEADPDFIPRNDDFGLNRELFYKTFCKNDTDPCPEYFYRIAFLCCNLEPDKRPSFIKLQEWFERICIHCTIVGSFHAQLPPDLLIEMKNFGCEYDINFLTLIATNITLIERESQMEVKTLEVAPTALSPHLTKDFNANGDRNRDSSRARRKQKIHENRQRAKKENNVTESLNKKPSSSSNKSSI